jgi:1-acyl-sn-glycerol-3-phosphate acyltransferase
VPLLPIVITGSHRIWEHPFSARLRYRQSVAVEVLPPVGATELRSSGPDALRRRLQRLMKSVALSPGRPPPRHYVAARDGEWPGFRFELDADWQAGGPGSSPGEWERSQPSPSSLTLRKSTPSERSLR